MADRPVYAALTALVTVAVVGLLFLGPVGWVLAALVVLSTFALAEFSGAVDGATGPERRNCPACGAPNAPERPDCRHCGASLAE